MKSLNKQATKIALKLYELLQASGDHLKIDNNKPDSGLMAVSLERKQAVKGFTGTVFSVAHYYIQNGDLMSDPYMEFIVDERLEIVCPILYEQHSLGIYQEAIAYDENGNSKGYYKKMQADFTSFANMWMKNIAWQQKVMTMTLPKKEDHSEQQPEANS
jgi:hypothetical protein